MLHTQWKEIPAGVQCRRDSVNAGEKRDGLEIEIIAWQSTAITDGKYGLRRRKTPLCELNARKFGPLDGNDVD